MRWAGRSRGVGGAWHVGQVGLVVWVGPGALGG